MSEVKKTKKSKKGKKKGFTLSAEDSAIVAPPVAPAPTPTEAASSGAGGSGASTEAPAVAPTATAPESPTPASPPPAPASGAGAAVVEFQVDKGEKKSCRFYRKDFPDVDDVVVVLVKSFKRHDPGAIAELLEYDGLEGMILTSELSKRRIRSVYKLLTVGSVEPVKVLRVDRAKGYIDLSKRQADHGEKQEAMDRYYRSKSVNIILYNAARKLDVPLEDLYEKIAYPLADKFGHTFTGFNEAVSDGTVLTSLEGVDEAAASCVRRLIRRRLAPKPVTLSCELELTCFKEIGIEAIRAALIAARDTGTADLPVAAKVDAAPKYMLATTTADTSAGEALLKKAIGAAEASLKGHGGKLVAKEIVIPEQETLSDSD